MRTKVHAVTLLACAPFLSGCIVDDIHDSLVEISARMGPIEKQLTETNTELAQIRTRLDKLDSIDESLASIDTSLHTVDEDLDGVSTTLSSLDVHLASLRRTLSNIDSTIPFLKLSDDEPVEDAPVETPSTDGEGEAGGEQPG